MRNLNLLKKTFSQARHVSGTHQFNGASPPLTVKANHLSSWRTLARQGKLVVPEVAGAEFAAPVATAQAVDTPVATASIDLLIGPVTVRLDTATPAARIAELIMALRAYP